MDSLVHFKNMIGRGQVQVDDGDDDDDDDEDDGDGEDEDEDGDDEDAGHHVLSYMCVCVSATCRMLATCQAKEEQRGERKWIPS